MAIFAAGDNGSLNSFFHLVESRFSLGNTTYKNTDQTEHGFSRRCLVLIFPFGAQIRFVMLRKLTGA